MKAKKIITLVVTGIAAFLAILSGIMKLTGGAEAAAGLQKAGVGQYMVMLGLMEIMFAALFIYPRTMKIGFLLLSCYFAGAIATELSHSAPLNALMPITILWIAAFLRDRSIFLPGYTPDNNRAS